jgi:hypothetical protein
MHEDEYQSELEHLVSSYLYIYGLFNSIVSGSDCVVLTLSLHNFLHTENIKYGLFTRCHIWV